MGRIDSGPVRAQGFIDRVGRTRDGAIEIHDYKTGRWVPKQEQIDEDRQLAFYQIGVTEKYGDDAPVRLVWHYVFRNQVRTSTRTREQLDALRVKTANLIDRIRGESVFEPKPSNLCSWCEYNDICPAMSREVGEPAEPPGAEARASAPPPRPGQLPLL